MVVTDLTGNPYLAASVAIPATMLAGLRGCYQYHLQLKKGGAAAALHPLVESFGPSHFGNVPELTRSRQAEIEEEAAEICKSLPSPAALLELEYRGMPIGDLVYDSAMRIKPWQATVWKIDDRVLRELRRVLQVIAAVDALCERHQVKAAVISRMNNSYIGTMLRCFVHRGIESYQGNNRVVRHTGFPVNHNMKPTPWLLQTAMTRHREAVLAAANASFAARFAGEVAPGEVSGERPRVYSCPEEFCAEFDLDPSRPCVFVMLHALNDFPHLFRESAFQDYYHWVIETLEAVADFEKVNWVFKQHPYIQLYPDDGDLAGKVRARCEKHIRFVEADVRISRRSLASIAHAFVTCLGTAAIEYGAGGVPSVVAAESFYTGFDLVHECFEKQKYFQALREIHRLPRLTPERRERAKVILYLSSADLNKSRFALTPAYSPAEALTPDSDALLEYMMRQQPTPEHRRSLDALRLFFESPDRDQYLDPNLYPWVDA